MDYSPYLKANARNYIDINAVCKDIHKLAKTYKELRPKIETFTHNNGSQQHLINLTGTIPVFYKGRQYNIPIRMVVLEKYPVMAPYVFVQPTSTMSIKQGRHVDANGKVYLPYLSEWKKGRHDMKGLIEILCTVFGQAPPVVANRGLVPSRPAQPPQQQQQPPVMTHTPYPTGQAGPAAYPQQPAYPAYPAQVTGPPTHPSYAQPPPYPPYGQPATPYGQQPPAYPAQPPPMPVPQQHQQQQQQSPIDSDAVIVDSIRSAIHDAIQVFNNWNTWKSKAINQRRTKSIETELQMELQTLTQTEVELKAGRNRICEIQTLLTSEKTSVGLYKYCDNFIIQQTIEATISALEIKLTNATAELNSLNESNTQTDPDAILQPATPIFKQIFNAHAQEQV